MWYYFSFSNLIYNIYNFHLPFFGVRSSFRILYSKVQLYFNDQRRFLVALVLVNNKNYKHNIKLEQKVLH